MEKNGKRRPFITTGYNSELEKFKRRLIRAVARMLLHEKRNENEVWSGLKQETGCDCKELWDRMHALTIKKLGRLLEAQDRTDMLPKAARMSITDWLLFDHVIVHEDIDFIGMSETAQTDREVLVDLFDLVEQFNIESLAGDSLAEAWSHLTLSYNKDNRRCSPMLLQRRWYQLKMATRARFYKFWSLYKGQMKTLHLAEPYKPTPLQTQIAKKYKPLVVKPFMLWNDLVTNKLVILPEEFDPKQYSKQSNSDENSPDVLCLETNVETIDLDVDSDTELEYRKSEEKKEEVPIVRIKQEPKDYEIDEPHENVPYENRQEQRSHFVEAVMEATALELDEIDLEEDINKLINSKPQEPEGHNEVTVMEEIVKDKVSEVTEVPSQLENTDVEGTSMNDISKTANVIPIINGQEDNAQTQEDNPRAEELNNEVHTIEDDVHLDEVTSNEPEPILPQITSIFGGVDVNKETLNKISLLTSEITNSKGKTIMENDAKSDDTIELSSDDKYDAAVAGNDVTEDVIELPDNDSDIDIKPDINKTWLNELSNDIEFADDGIELLDDGIAYHDDEFEYKIDIKSEIKMEIEEHEVTQTIEEEDIPEVDKKLLMVPVVPTVKLDDMGILPIDLLHHVDNKAILDIIAFKSKAIRNKVDDVSSESSEEIVDIKKVRLSSALLQKPRSRTYNPIQLCKNPDFNTRLKRLTVGFFSSSRNRLLLKGCNPLTIDVSKAFENRLINGTMYLKESDGIDLPKTVNFEENSQVSVMPSAMPVQSLIDHTNADNTSLELPQMSRHSYTPSPVETACERNKVINLPDITEIRRMNQTLLTAQVTPLQVNNNTCLVPVTIVPETNINNKISKRSMGRYIAGPASRTKIKPPEIVDITKDDTVINPPTNLQVNITKSKENWMTDDKARIWRSRQIRPETPWFINCSSIYDSDTLLALDTLNKMLFLLSDDGFIYTPNGSVLKKSVVKKPKGRPRKKSHESAETLIDVDDKTSVSETDNDLIEVDDNDVQVVGESKLNSFEINKSSKPNTIVSYKKNKPIFCCWARERICKTKKRVSKHNCAYPLCICCCKLALVEYLQICKDSKKKAAKDSNNTNENFDISTQEDIAQETLEGAKSKPSTGSNNQNQIIIEPNELTPNKEPDITGVLQAGDVNLGAEVSIASSEETDHSHAECNDVVELETTSTLPNTDVNPAPFKKPRFRIAHSVASNTDIVRNPKLREHSTSDNLINVTSGDNNTNPKLRGHSTSDNLIKVTSGDNNTLVVKETQLMTCTKQDISRKIDTNHASLKQYIGKHNKNVKKSMKSNTLKSKSHNVHTTNENQKLIYLNSKHISKVPSENPIFLGKNKILLTTAKFPPNFKAFEELQRNLRQTYALPKGIQLILQPNGKLTYIRFPRSNINEKFLEAMPALIEAFQQQIDGCVPILVSGEEQPVATNLQNEVISLSDDEMPEVKEINDKACESSDIIEQTNSNDNHPSETATCVNSLNEKQNDKIEATENDTEAIESYSYEEVQNNNFDEIQYYEQQNHVSNPTLNDNQTTQNNTLSIPQNDNLSPTQNNNSEELNNGCNVALNSTSEIPQVEENNHIAENKTTITPNVEETIETTNRNESESLETTHQNTDNKANEDNTSKTKNILSDLMAMSGIEPIDDSPTQETSATEAPINQESSTQPQPMPSVSQHSQQISNTETENENLKKTLLLQALTAITSLSELKYACSQNGSFFKLDFDTGVLVPINVCMKKLCESTKLRNHSRKNSREIETTSPKPVIDLTDDDVEMTNVTLAASPATKSLLISNNTAMDSNTTAITINENESTNKTNRPSISIVKPLKLFKSGISRPNILERKLKEIQKRISDAMTAQDLIRRKLKRKQELSAMDSDDVMIADDDSSDCSSDEEPLAQVAKKMRATDNKEQTILTEPVDDHIDKVIDQIEDTGAPMDEITKVVDEPDDTLLEEDDLPIECLEERLEDDEETCILGV